MLDGPLLTAEDFLDTRFSLPESGQWAELDAGSVSLFQPPDLDHGNTVLNLSKAFADYVQTHQRGYACFDLGLLMETRPDTVRFPAACYFLEGDRFAETDKPYTETIPEIIIELASTTDRRKVLPRRVEDYLAWGTQLVWLIDPAEELVQLVDKTGQQRELTAEETLTIDPLLPGFSCQVDSLFVEPRWWSAM